MLSKVNSIRCKDHAHHSSVPVHMCASVRVHKIKGQKKTNKD